MIELILGIGGTVFILTAFVLDEFYKKFRQDSIQYNLINIIGSGLLLIYGLFLQAWPFVILNAVWFIVAVIKLKQILSKKKR